jgi:3-phenylpropionate/cinnamic acid dioxygenase small subunit
MKRSEAEDFLTREARLLDERKFEDWLELFDDSARYWVPTKDETDPGLHTSLVFDDRSTLEDRVSRLQDSAAHAQSPPSTTRHFITNVEVEELGNGETKIYSNFLVYEIRMKRERLCAGWCEHRLRQYDNRWLITEKKVCLINSDQAIYNLTFLL